MRDETPTPDAGTGEPEPRRRTETVRDTLGDRVLVEWDLNTYIPTDVRILTKTPDSEDEVAYLDLMEIPQAIRSLRAVLAEDSDSAVVRNMGVFERLWFESRDGFVTLCFERARDLEAMLVLEEREANRLLNALESARDEIADVEDDPYV